MSHYYDRTGERIDDDEPEVTGPDLCREALAAAEAARRCRVCGGQLRPGVVIHPACREAL